MKRAGNDLAIHDQNNPLDTHSRIAITTKATKSGHTCLDFCFCNFSFHGGLRRFATKSVKIFLLATSEFLVISRISFHQIIISQRFPLRTINKTGKTQ
ncbi:MAG: hypothetical protein DLM72_05900 [Candidatus Nitrosopolaris wilkensis]|nr:MAG: hypothetical protein DLM72_05900 [Candidatus Nitrosopolaris wilkensis]